MSEVDSVKIWREKVNCLFGSIVNTVQPVLGLVSTDNDFGNEIAFKHSKDYLYYLARSPLSLILDNETSPQN